MQAITRQPSGGMTGAELTHISRVPIDMDLANRQHAAYRRALESCGLTVVNLPELEQHPDCAFVEDVAVSFPELSILCRPGANSRRDETPSIRSSLPYDRPIFSIDSPGTLDGGDVLRVGRDVFVGRSSRTNIDGIRMLAAHVGLFGYRVTQVDVPLALHLKTGVTALSDDQILINPEWVDRSVFRKFHAIDVAPREPFAANSLNIFGKIVYAAEHFETARRLERAGYTLVRAEIGEFAKVEAGVTCMSIVISDLG